MQSRTVLALIVLSILVTGKFSFAAAEKYELVLEEVDPAKVDVEIKVGSWTVSSLQISGHDIQDVYWPHLLKNFDKLAFAIFYARAENRRINILRSADDSAAYAIRLSDLGTNEVDPFSRSPLTVPNVNPADITIDHGSIILKGAKVYFDSDEKLIAPALENARSQKKTVDLIFDSTNLRDLKIRLHK